MSKYNQTAVEFEGYETTIMATKRSKEKSMKVSTSFGVMDTVASFLTGYEITCLQDLNKFFYNRSVARVQMRIIPKTPLAYFFWPYGSLLSNALISYD